MVKDNIISSQFEIMRCNNADYATKGGYSVTIKKIIIYIVVTTTFSVVLGYIVCRYGPNENVEKVIINTENIQDLLDGSIRQLPVQNINLPKTVVPLHYKIRLSPQVEDLTFSGEVSIKIRAMENTTFIVLNVDELDLYNISIKQIGNKKDRIRRNINETILSSLKQNNSTKVNSPGQDMYNEYYPMEAITKNESSKTTTNTSVFSRKQDDLFNITAKFALPFKTKTETHIEKIPNIRRNINIYKTRMLDTITVLSKKIDQVSSQCFINLSRPLNINQTYILEISYTGKISDNFQGLYFNNYTNNESKEKYIVASNLQPIFARRIFPCFDEPEMKATFDVSIIRKENMHSLSNMRLKRTYNLSNDLMEDQFETTPPMPTCQVAVILLNSDYYSSTNEVSNISIWAPKENVKDASCALEKVGKIVGYYNEYFDLKYALSKLDIITIPALPSMATENWGLIFLKESVLLNGEDERGFFSYLAENLAQEWFGNLVTIKWWDDLWLLKGFALLAADEAGVKINQWISEFTLTVTQNMLAFDDYKSTSSLKVNVINTLQINELFEIDTYRKGGCLLKMLKSSIPEKLFRKNLQNFLKQRMFESVSRKDFWNSINNETEKYLPNKTSISDIMENWISQAGYPLITIVEDGETSSINITQSKFQAVNKSDNSIWIIPLNYMIGGEGENKLWLTERSITVTNISTDKWILFNVKRTGYYRVNYDDKNWKQLIEVLNGNHELIPIENRGQLINDAFKLAENGLLDYQIPFNLPKYLQTEKDYIPWASFLNSLEFLKQILRSTYLNEAYEEYIRNLVSNLYDEMQNNTFGNQRLRRLIIETACSVNYQPCINWARSRFSNWMQNGIQVPCDMQETIFCSAVRTGGRKEWNFLWEQIKLHETNSYIRNLFMGLGCSKDTWLINKYLRNTVTGEIPWQYVPYVWQSLNQPTSLAFGFKYLRENWYTIYRAYKYKPTILESIVKDFLYLLSSKSDFEDLALFASNHEEDLQELRVLIKDAMDKIELRVEWSTKYLYQIEQLLSD